MTTPQASHAPPPVFKAAYTIHAPQSRIWAALTDPDDLRKWFAEHAEIEARPDGKYRFWGRFTPTFGVPGEPDQKIVELDPPKRLAFSWTWAGAPTHCELKLEPSDASTTRLHVRHQVLGKMVPFDVTECGWFARDFWELIAGNLDNYLRKGKAAVRPDHAAKGNGVTLSIEIDAPPAKVWDAITVPEKIARWLCDNPEFPPQVSVDLRIGGNYSFGWKKDGEPIGPKEVLELEPGRRLLYAWHYPGDTTSRTEWTLDPLPGGRTLLTVRQIGTATDRERSGYANGWASFMVAISRATE